ncbi:MAG: PTS transporter subunit EIIC, partial [Clostridiales bacterium]|nr:PTS transporter subunit EIIC [Clostridiales bacterium]
MEEGIKKLADRISDNLIISSISRGLVALIPVVLIGAFLTAALNIPIPAWQDFLNNKVAGSIGVTLAQTIQYATINAVSIAALFSVSYSISHRNIYVRNRELGVRSFLLTALSSYIILTAMAGNMLLFRQPGGQGLLFALICAIGSERLFTLFFTILRKRRFTRLNTYTQLRSAVRAILPMLLTLVVFALIRVFVMDPFFQNGTFEADIMRVVNRLMAQDSAGAAVLIMLIVQACWFFGLHGGFLITDNLPAASSFTPEVAQHTILSRDFFFTFPTIGGAGLTIGLLLVLLLVGSRGRDKPLARLSIIPAVFNINETLTYGVPIIFNPFYFIPFLAAPVVCGLLSYEMIAAGWVPHIVATGATWATPVFYSGYITTGG